MPPLTEALLSVSDLQVWYPLQRGWLATLLRPGEQRYLKAVDGISFAIRAGELMGLAGESGCGKSTTGLSILGLQPRTGGEIRFGGQRADPASTAFRRGAQMVFQDPYGSLNPRFTIARMVMEPLLIHGIGSSRQERLGLVKAALEEAELTPGEEYLERFPHELSGGQKQRVAIARAIVLRPQLLVADEPVSMLDVSIRAGVLRLFRHFAQDLGMAVLYVSHDLSTIRFLCQSTAIMYLGRIMERGDTARVLDSPRHPYTQALLAAVPVPDPENVRERIVLQGSIPSPVNLPPGCRFATRCPHAKLRCTVEEPALRQLAPDHWVACHFA